MSSIEFDEPQQISYKTIDISRAVTHNTPLLIKWRIVKDLQTANTVMIALCIFMIIGSILIYNSRPSAKQKVYREDYSEAELKGMHPIMVNNLPLKPK